MVTEGWPELMIVFLPLLIATAVTKIVAHGQVEKAELFADCRQNRAFTCAWRTCSAIPSVLV